MADVFLQLSGGAQSDACCCKLRAGRWNSQRLCGRHQQMAATIVLESPDELDRCL